MYSRVVFCDSNTVLSFESLRIGNENKVDQTRSMQGDYCVLLRKLRNQIIVEQGRHLIKASMSKDKVLWL